MGNKKIDLLDKVKAFLAAPQGDIRNIKAGLKALEKAQQDQIKMIQTLELQKVKVKTLKAELKVAFKNCREELKVKRKAEKAAAAAQAPQTPPAPPVQK